MRATSPPRANRANPPHTATGVAKPIAHGHATSSTAIALNNASLHSTRPDQNHPVPALVPSTSGRKNAINRSACACRRLGAKRAAATVAKTPSSCRGPAFTFTSSAPSTACEPAHTASPGPFATGAHSPVIDVSCTSARPATITPSTQIARPTPTTTVSPPRNSRTATARSAPAPARTTQRSNRSRVRSTARNAASRLRAPNIFPAVWITIRIATTS